MDTTGIAATSLQPRGGCHLDRSTQYERSPSISPRSQPTLIALKRTEHLQLQLVTCHPGLDGALAELLLPKSTRIEYCQLQFDNPNADAGVSA